MTFIYKWLGRFKLNHISFKDEPRSGRPLNTEPGKYDSKILTMIMENPGISIKTLAKVMRSSMTKAYNYIKNNLGLKKVCCKSVPFTLNEKQKQSRIDFCNNFLNQYGDINKKISYNLVTGDETWLRCYDPLIGP